MHDDSILASEPREGKNRVRVEGGVADKYSKIIMKNIDTSKGKETVPQSTTASPPEGRLSREEED